MSDEDKKADAVQTVQFNKEQAQKLRAALAACAEQICEEMGFSASLSLGTIRFNPNEMTTKLTVMRMSQDHRLNDLVAGEKPEDADRWAIQHGAFGFSSTDRLRTFTSEGKRFRLLSVDKKKSKYPAIASTADGKRFKFTADKVLNKLKRDRVEEDDSEATNGTNGSTKKQCT